MTSTPVAKRFKALRGFTLIELMIAVSVVGILAAIAYPSYQDYVRRARRAAAQSVLLEVAQKEQQVFLDIRSYATAANTAALVAAPLRVAVPSNVTAFYGFSVAVTTPANAPPQFVVTAAPQGAQATDKCGSMTINHLGAKSAALTTGCW